MRCEFNEYLKLKRNEFQSWFADVMERAYPGDFQRVRQTQGDRGCDGYRISTKTVYQVYAPREIRPSVLNRKIKDDFNQALHEFGGKMAAWTFVHNDPDGLTPDTTVDTFGGLNAKYPGIIVATHTFNEIWSIIKNLDVEKIEDLFGFAPTFSHLHRLQLTEIVPVLRFIEKHEVPLEITVIPPDPEKLEFNAFSEAVQDLISGGRRKSTLVQQYFEKVRDPMYGESLAEAFREKYGSLTSSNLFADEIFDELRKFTGGDYFHDASKQAAVLAILSYFFERCDIFENPDES
ncbi:MAG: hypothetical protein B6240_13520 [Desulfobacteraceae bacterium 4572_87]|nr:MAG: hypothetical protein B6240_13520 [Desulfobacteraceae bacterium 4572_87]